MSELGKILEPLKRGAGIAQRNEVEAHIEAYVEKVCLEVISDDEDEQDTYGLGKLNQIRNILRQEQRNRLKDYLGGKK